MGPLFSAAIAAAVFAIVVVSAFSLLRLFLPSRQAFPLAFGLGVGGFLGAGVAGVAAALVLGVGPTLRSGVTGTAYLGVLCLAALFGGGIGARQASRVWARCSRGQLSASTEVRRSAP